MTISDDEGDIPCTEAWLRRNTSAPDDGSNKVAHGRFQNMICTWGQAVSRCACLKARSRTSVEAQHATF